MNEVEILQGVRQRFQSGEYEWANGPSADPPDVCLVLAIYDFADLDNAPDGSEPWHRVQGTCNALLDTLKVGDDWSVGTLLGYWNDRPGRTKEDVLSLLDFTIGRMRRPICSRCCRFILAWEERHPTGNPFHVQCQEHERCYTLCDHIELPPIFEHVKKRHAQRLAELRNFERL